MYEKKKILIETVFERAKNEIPRGNKSSISSYLSSLFEERYGFEREERSYVRYYKSLVQENTDYNIDDLALDYLSKYIGYKSFNDFSDNVSVQGGDGSTTFKMGFGEIISDKINQVIVTVTNNPVFTVPHLAKNGMGIGALILILVAGFAYGGGGIPKMNENKYMYWKNDKYVGTDSAYVNSGIEVIAMNKSLLLHLRKINRPDTLTIENSKGKVWYDKSNNHVEFFTSPGIHPENGKALKDVSETIIDHHAGADK